MSNIIVALPDTCFLISCEACVTYQPFILVQCEIIQTGVHHVYCLMLISSFSLYKSFKVMLGICSGQCTLYASVFHYPCLVHV